MKGWMLTDVLRTADTADVACLLYKEKDMNGEMEVSTFFPIWSVNCSIK
jgi:hypothetical protein